MSRIFWVASSGIGVLALLGVASIFPNPYQYLLSPVLLPLVSIPMFWPYLLGATVVTALSRGSYGWKAAGGFFAWFMVSYQVIWFFTPIVAAFPGAFPLFVAGMGVSFPMGVSYFAVGIGTRILQAKAPDEEQKSEPAPLPKNVQSAFNLAKKAEIKGVDGKEYMVILGDFPLMKEPTAMERQREFFERESPALLRTEDEVHEAGEWRFFGLEAAPKGETETEPLLVEMSIPSPASNNGSWTD